jgi:hypothetical protein
MTTKPGQLLGALALAVAIVALVFAYLSWRRSGEALDAHNALVTNLTRERTGLGALLEAAGVPGGRSIGNTVEALMRQELGPDRRATRSADIAREWLAVIDTMLANTNARIAAQGESTLAYKSYWSPTLGERRAQIEAARAKLVQLMSMSETTSPQPEIEQTTRGRRGRASDDVEDSGRKPSGD